MIKIKIDGSSLCKQYNNEHKICVSDSRISEKGKTVELKLKNNQELVSVVVIDGCLIKDNEYKCDALFLFYNFNKKFIFLVELKGAGDIPHAFEQLAYTKKYRSEYKNIKESFDTNYKGKLHEVLVIVSNGLINKKDFELLERKHGIRVRSILHSEPSKKIPNLRDIV